MGGRKTNYHTFGACIVYLIAACLAQRYSGERCTDSRRRLGVCTPLGQCVSAQKDLKKGVRPTKCSFSGYQPIVCCRDETPTTKPTFRPQVQNTPPSPRKSGERAKYWCKVYSKSCPLFSGIARGYSTIPDEFPHLAAVGYGVQNDIKWKCGGSLISDKFILTAAHCLRGGKDGPVKWILLGTLNLAVNESLLGTNGQIHRVVRRIRHPGYRPPEKYNDIALLEIGSALTRNPETMGSEKLHPACLRTDESEKYQSYIATAWGRVGPGLDSSMDLLKMELKTFNAAKCNETFETEIRSTTQLRRGIDSTMMCAGVSSV